MRNDSDKSCRENQNTHFVSSNFFPEDFAIFETKWKSTLEPNMPKIIIRRMRTACWITKAKNTHSEYVILLHFPLQQWLHERA
jgi:hypothetical protein